MKERRKKEMKRDEKRGTRMPRDDFECIRS